MSKLIGRNRIVGVGPWDRANEGGAVRRRVLGILVATVIVDNVAWALANQ